MLSFFVSFFFGELEIFERHFCVRFHLAELNEFLMIRVATMQYLSVNCTAVKPVTKLIALFVDLPLRSPNCRSKKVPWLSTPREIYCRIPTPAEDISICRRVAHPGVYHPNAAAATSAVSIVQEISTRTCALRTT